jgi:predicted dehydrogenase
MEAGKHVFCEKPLCVSEEELGQIASVYQRARFSATKPLLMVGYNRRFAPLAMQVRDFFQGTQEPLMMHYRINAGFLPHTHWTQMAEEGAGRIIGEVCHFIDFLVWLSGRKVTSVYATVLPNAGKYSDDNLAATLEFAGGAVGTITYVANGDKSFPKERIEVFGNGAVATLDDFRILTTVQAGRTRTFRSRLRQDKGHSREWTEFANAICGGNPSPIEFGELVNVSQVCFRMLDSLRDRERHAIEDTYGL